MEWIDVMPAAELEAEGKSLVRVDGQQILVMATKLGVRACPNRCPHEGFPLSEGELSPDNVLRCNWHNWTFDLESGETVIGGDRLLQVPAKIELGRVFLAPRRSDPADVRARALEGISAALEDADQARLLREVARLELARGSAHEAILLALRWLAPRSRYGTAHAVAGAADWIALAESADTTPDRRLAAIGEVLGHVADDGRRETRYPYATDVAAWDRDGFLAAIEACDEPQALALVRGALAAGSRFRDLVPALATAALSHYADFGHSLIYVAKSAELAERLGDAAEEPLLCMLVRSLCYATREDLIPEFRAYRGALARLAPALADTSAPRDQRVPYGESLPIVANASVADALETVVAWSATHSPRAIFRALVDSAAAALRHADEASMTTTAGSIAHNTNWLDHTHAITFAEAGERVARNDPALWAPLLLQIACFLGRNHAFIDHPDTWHSGSDPAAEDDGIVSLADLRESLFDHGRDRFIISVHLIKTLFAATNLIENGHADPGVMTRALVRFFHAPIKGRHVIRTARQMLALAADGV